MKIQQVLSPASRFAVVKLSSLYKDRIEGLVNYNGSVVHCSATRTASGNIVWTYDPSRRVALGAVREVNNALCLDGERYRLVPRDMISMYIETAPVQERTIENHIEHPLLKRIFSFLMQAFA